MNKAHLITLLTDFGLHDAYVGMMKGVIARIAPNASVIDLTHAIPPQDLWAAQFNLRMAYPYFPTNTIHLSVVDPGVGTQRQAIALQTDSGYFVAPDNGLLTPLLQQATIHQAITLDNPDYWLTAQPSRTFHGRDIFAPIAAHLAQGVAIAQLGRPIDPTNLIQLPLTPPEITPTRITGIIQYIDHFGNCITNIRAIALMPEFRAVQIADTQVLIGSTYGDRAPGQLVALIGSHGCLEMGINQGNAAQQFGWQVGQEVRVKGEG